MESRVKALSYRSFTARDRLWTSSGTPWKEGHEPLWIPTLSRVVDPLARRAVDKTILLIKSMNTIKKSLNQPVEFRIALHAVSDRVNGVHNGGMVHVEGTSDIGKR